MRGRGEGVFEEGRVLLEKGGRDGMNRLEKGSPWCSLIDLF